MSPLLTRGIVDVPGGGKETAKFGIGDDQQTTAFVGWPSSVLGVPTAKHNSEALDAAMTSPFSGVGSFASSAGPPFGQVDSPSRFGGESNVGSSGCIASLNQMQSSGKSDKVKQREEFAEAANKDSVEVMQNSEGILREFRRAITALPLTDGAAGTASSAQLSPCVRSLQSAASGAETLGLSLKAAAMKAAGDVEGVPPAVDPLRVPDVSVGGEYEGRNAQGLWWSVRVTARNVNGTFQVDVNDGHGTRWASLDLACMRQRPARHEMDHRTKYVKADDGPKVTDEVLDSLQATLAAQRYEMKSGLASDVHRLRDLRAQNDHIRASCLQKLDGRASTYTVIISKNGPLGMTLRAGKMGGREIVSIADDGLVRQFNDSNPAQVVFCGDEILEVNGVTGTDAISRELSQSRRMTIRLVRKSAANWRITCDGSVAIRSGPSPSYAETGEALSSDEVFPVSEEHVGDDGVLFLCLAGRGWISTQKPSVGMICGRAVASLESPRGQHAAGSVESSVHRLPGHLRAAQRSLHSSGKRRPSPRAAAPGSRQNTSIQVAGAQGFERSSPVLECATAAALSALGTLSKANIQEVKSMAKPPEGVVLVCRALCCCFGIPPRRTCSSDGSKLDDYWVPAKALMANPEAFLNRLCNYNKDNIPAGIIQKLSALEANPAFEPDAIRKASAAASGLCRWVRAIIAYDRAKASQMSADNKLNPIEKRSASPNTQSTVSRETTISESAAASDAPSTGECRAPLSPVAPSSAAAAPSQLRRPKSPDELRQAAITGASAGLRRAVETLPRSATDAAERRRSGH